jgi:hypothetical protein
MLRGMETIAESTTTRTRSAGSNRSSSLDAKIRMDAFGKIQKILIDDAVLLPNYERGRVYVLDPRIKGAVHRALERILTSPMPTSSKNPNRIPPLFTYILKRLVQASLPCGSSRPRHLCNARRSGDPLTTKKRRRRKSARTWRNDTV